MRDFIESLIELDKTDLFERARTVRVQNALTEWQMAAMLMAIERQRAYLECGCSSITVYADKKLGLHPKKTRALLRLARICTYHELVSKAFKDGSLCWTKVREIGRVLDDHNEEKWVKYAVTHTVRQVERAVAKPPASLRKPTSRLECPMLFDITSDTLGQCGVRQRVILMRGPDKPAEDDATEMRGGDEPAEDDATEMRGGDEPAEEDATALPGGDEPADETAGDEYTEEENEAMAEEYFAQQRALKPWLYEKRPLPDWIPSGPTGENEQPDEEPPPTRLIRMTFVFKPGEYAAVEAGLRKAQGQMRKRQTQSEQLVHVMQQFLATGSECTKARYPVVIQIEGHDAVYVTDRGDLPVAADKLQVLLAQARPPRKSPSGGPPRKRPSGGPPRAAKNVPKTATGTEQPVNIKSLSSQPPSESCPAVCAPGHGHAREHLADQTLRVSQPSLGPADQTRRVSQPSLGPADQTWRASQPMVGQAEQTWHVSQPLLGQAEQILHVSQPMLGGDIARNDSSHDPTVNHLADPMSDFGQTPNGESSAANALLHDPAADQLADALTHMPDTALATASRPASVKARRRTISRPNAIREVMARSGWACVRCGSRDRLELDHAVPLCRGGSDDVEAQDAVCDDCHEARHYEDFKCDPVFEQGRRHALKRREQHKQTSGGASLPNTELGKT
jgi:hypothetical protein